MTDSLPAAGRAGLRSRRTAARACQKLVNLVVEEMISLDQSLLRHVSGPQPRRLQRAQAAWLRRAEAALSAEAGGWQLDRHHVPDRAAMRHRPGPDAHQGRARRRRQLPITGTKIFISAGEHDLTENIVHLVLARLPDAPAGTRGISLFLVPKFLPNRMDAARATASPAAASSTRWASRPRPPA